MVYIVDDSRFIQQRLIRRIEDLVRRDQIITAERADQVEKDLNELAPKIMVIDFHLAEGNGFDVLTFIKKKNINPTKIFLSNYTDKPYQERAFALGADHCLNKSSEFEKAVEIVRDEIKKGTQ